ncbi:hypothetical protein EG68_12376, partial [Paragonimus skrjabini miyazakii]
QVDTTHCTLCPSCLWYSSFQQRFYRYIFPPYLLVCRFCASMPESYEIVKYLEVCSSEQSSLLKAVSRKLLNVLSFGRKILILDSNYAIISSVTHCECVTDVALTPDASILLFTDTRGTLSIYFPSEDRGVFSLTHFGSIKFIRIVSDENTGKFSLLLAAERLIYWPDLESFLLKSALVNQDSECLFSLLRGAIDYPDSDGSYPVSIHHTALNWTLQLSAPVPMLYAASTGLVFSEPVFTPSGCFASDQVVFSKAFFINPVYCVALSTSVSPFLCTCVCKRYSHRTVEVVRICCRNVCLPYVITTIAFVFLPLEGFSFFSISLAMYHQSPRNCLQRFVDHLPL